MNFKILKVPLTEEEKRIKIRLYNQHEYLKIDEDEYVKQEIYEEYVEFKCLNCNHEDFLAANIVLECFKPSKVDYPILYCPKCGEEQMIPKDVYEQIKEQANNKN